MALSTGWVSATRHIHEPVSQQAFRRAVVFRLSTKPSGPFRGHRNLLLAGNPECCGRGLESFEDLRHSSKAGATSQRYIDCPLQYNMQADIRSAQVETVLSYDDRHFRHEARMSKVCFWRLVNDIRDNPVFSNQSHREHNPSHQQLLVPLFT